MRSTGDARGSPQHPGTPPRALANEKPRSEALRTVPRGSGRLRARAVVVPRALGAMVATAGRRRAPAAPRRILVAHHLLLGDTLMLTPLLAKLRELHPAADVVMAAPKPVVPLYGRTPYGVRVLAYDPRDARTLSRLHDEAAGDGFDLAVVPGDNRYSWVASALGARWIVAFAGDRPAYKSLPVDDLRPYPATPGTWGDAVAALVDGPAPRPYDPADWPDPAAGEWLRPDGPYTVLHVGASTALKRWEPGKWDVLAQRLEARGLAVVWSAGRGEEDIVRAIDPHARRRSYAGALDLAQLWHLVKGARVVVAPDTGVAHLGRLTATPTVALFGPGSAVLCGAGDFWRDSPYRAVTVPDFPCRDQRVLFKREVAWVRRCGRGLSECPAPRCMHAIGVDEVEQAAVEVMERAG